MEFIKAKIIWIVLGLGALLTALFASGIYSKTIPPVNPDSTEVEQKSDEIRVVSTVPANLHDTTILPNQTIELTFSEALVNEPETRWKITPSADIKAELSADKKTLKLIPNKPYDLGSGYTLFLSGETKFDNKKNLGREIIYSFKTIQFKGS